MPLPPQSLAMRSMLAAVAASIAIVSSAFHPPAAPSVWAPARSVWTRAGLVAPTPPPPRRRVCPPLLDALHPPHDRRPHVPAGGEDGEGNDDDGNQQPKTMAKASSLPLELAPSRSTTRRRTTTVAKRGSQQQSWAEAVGPYIDILRPQNIVPAMLLVLMGAWQATHDVKHVLDPVVLTMALASALVAVGSCVLNDYLDLHVDQVNKPDSALVAGRVKPAHALLISVALLGAAFGTSFVAPAACLRTIVRAAVVAVTLYTPVFKPVPLVKNGVVALVTAASLALGGLAAGGSFHAIFVPASLVFLGIYHREILMDICDVEGDKACQITTLPRLLGRSRALLAASGMFAGGTLLSAHRVLTQNLALGHGWAAAVVPTIVTLGAGAVACYHNCRIARRGFRHEDLSRWIALSPIPLTLMLFMLSTGTGVPIEAASAGLL